MKNASFGLGLAVISLLGACSGSSLHSANQQPDLGNAPVDECALTMQPCGGNLEGTWVSGPGCLGVFTSAGDADCPSLRYRTTKDSTTTLTFASGTFTSIAEGELQMEMVQDAACLGSLRCIDLSTDGLFCAGADECVCQITVPASDPFMGTYATSQSSLTQTYSDGEVVQLEYCVMGSSLYLIDADGGVSHYTKQL